LDVDGKDVIYADAGELENLAGSYSVIQRYPETGTVLVKLDRKPIK
jgi:hypothetical protein